MINRNKIYNKLRNDSALKENEKFLTIFLF